MKKSTPENHESSPAFNAPRCASCPFRRQDRLCIRPDGRHPDTCPTASHPGLTQKSLELFADEEIRPFARAAAVTERHSYHIREDGSRKPVTTRIEEIVDFCRQMKYLKLGLVFCIGLLREAGIVARIFEARGLDVVSAVCKAGACPKSGLDLAPDELLCPENPETMCNPILQAMLMNESKVDLNVLLGLCVGHDSLAIRYLKAPVTVLAVKDRMLGHNPLGALNCAESYYRYLEKPLD